MTYSYKVPPPPNNAPPKAIVVHYLSGGTALGSYDYFYKLAHDDGANGKKVSKPKNNEKYVQYVVAKDGTVYKFLPDNRKAAGAQEYNYIPEKGGISISIENEGTFGNNGGGYTSAQVKANQLLIAYLRGAYSISKEDVISHEEADHRVMARAENRNKTKAQIYKNPGDHPKGDPGNAFMKAIGYPENHSNCRTSSLGKKISNILGLTINADTSSISCELPINSSDYSDSGWADKESIN